MYCKGKLYQSQIVSLIIPVISHCQLSGIFIAKIIITVYNKTHHAVFQNRVSICDDYGN